jgi:translation elongation factor EF-1beta
VVSIAVKVIPKGDDQSNLEELTGKMKHILVKDIQIE